MSVKSFFLTQMEELVDIFDINECPTGVITTKLSAHQKGLWHASAHIWIYNSKGEVLLQKRSTTKDTFPGMWDISVAGHIDAGETPLKGALREVSEEIGVKLREKDLLYYTTIHMEYPYAAKGWINREHCYVYLCQMNVDPSTLVLQKEEVDDVKFFSLDEFKKMIKADRGIIVPHENYYNTIVEAIVKKAF